MKTYKETFDENIWDRTKAKAAGAVAGAKGWAGQTGRNVMGKDPADAGQAGAAAKLQAQADSLSKGAAAKLQKLLADVRNDLAKLGGFDSYSDKNFGEFNPALQKFLDNIEANIGVLAAGKVPLPDGDDTATTTPPPSAATTTPPPTQPQKEPETEPDGQQTLGL